MDTKYHIAEVNIAQMKAPLDDPIMADFVNNLDRINALAENTPGFVWRLKGDDGNATAMRVFDDDMLIINLTVWETIESLYEYTYSSDHVEIFRRRREWFEKMETPYFVMWWIPAGHIPTPQEAKDKLELIQHEGANPLAFTFKQRFTSQEMLAVMQSHAEAAPINNT